MATQPRRAGTPTVALAITVCALSASGCYMRHEARGGIDAAISEQDSSLYEPATDAAIARLPDAAPPDAGVRPPVEVRCAPQTADCNADPDDGCEADLRLSVAHCGGCGLACDAAHASSYCDFGSCRLGMCDVGFGDCDTNPSNGCEVDLANDRQHCGACSLACRTGFVCEAGRCVDDRDVVELGLGERFACARRRNGEVSCWGDNRVGQLGSADSALDGSRPVPIDVAALARLAVGFESACGIETGAPDAGDGEVSCWGNPARNTTALDLSACPDTGCEFAPHRVGLRARQLCVGYGASCAVTGDAGRVQCWGSDPLLLGRDTNEGSATPKPVVAGNGRPLRDARTLSCGMYASCAALEPTGVACWGYNLNSVLGVPRAELEYSQSALPIAAFAERHVEQVVVHQRTACALSEGRVACWGHNQEGALGRGSDFATLSEDPQPVDVGLSEVVALSGRRGTFCAITRSVGDTPARLHCWGRSKGLFGPDDTRLEHPSPEAMDFLGVVPEQLAGGSDSLCMRVAAPVGEQLLCWGRGAEGQLGDGSRTTRTGTPVAVDGW